jgi:hypothetical protein
MTKVSLVILSHLNDLEHDTDNKIKAHRLDFIRRLVINYPNTTTRLSDDELEELWNWND